MFISLLERMSLVWLAFRHRDSFHKEEMVAMDEKYTQEIDEDRFKILSFHMCLHFCW